MEKEYAQALSRSIASGTDEAKLVDGLVKHLKAEGRMKLLPAILRELKVIDARASSLAPGIEIASEEERKEAVSEATAAGLNTDTVRVNPALIRGWRAREGSTLVDRSAKQALVDLYQKITN